MNRLSVRLLIFNILLIFLPIGSLLYLNTYENQLLENQEQSMIQQGRILAAALNGRDLAPEAEEILAKLKNRVDARIRILDGAGNLLADTAVAAAPEALGNEVETGSETYSRLAESAEKVIEDASQTLLYRVMIGPVRIIRSLFSSPAPDYGSGEFYSGKKVLLGTEVQAALAGRYGAVTRISSGGQVSVNLYSAIPVWGSEKEEEVIGAVLVSRSTYRILQDLYEIRLDIMKIFLLSLSAAVLISLALSLTITKPLRKLKSQAALVLDSRGRFQSHFTGLKRGDEIGDLSRSLSELSQKLEERTAFIDTFTADMLHELKNPLAAIRSAAEICDAQPGKEERLIRTILEEEGRMERLLYSLKEVSRLDNRMDREEPATVDLNELLPILVSRYPHKEYPTIEVTFHRGIEGPAMVRAVPDRLFQLFTNPIDNAVSFSPPGKRVELRLEESGIRWRIAITDSGPGLREEEKEKVFQRFYSDREEAERRRHSGLGLSIVKAIAEKYGGSCRIENRREGGTLFEIFLPVVNLTKN